MTPTSSANSTPHIRITTVDAGECQLTVVARRNALQSQVVPIRTGLEPTHAGVSVAAGVSPVGSRLLPTPGGVGARGRYRLAKDFGQVLGSAGCPAGRTHWLRHGIGCH